MDLLFTNNFSQLCFFTESSPICNFSTKEEYFGVPNQARGAYWEPQFGAGFFFFFFLAVLNPCCCEWAFFQLAVSGAYSLVGVHGLIAVASLVVEHRL